MSRIANQKRLLDLASDSFKVWISMLLFTVSKGHQFHKTTSERDGRF